MIFWQVLTQPMEISLHLPIAEGTLEQRRVEDALSSPLGCGWTPTIGGLQCQRWHRAVISDVTWSCRSRATSSGCGWKLLPGRWCNGSIVIALRVGLIDLNAGIGGIGWTGISGLLLCAIPRRATMSTAISSGCFRSTCYNGWYECRTGRTTPAPHWSPRSRSRRRRCCGRDKVEKALLPLHIVRTICIRICIWLVWLPQVAIRIIGLLELRNIKRMLCGDNSRTGLSLSLTPLGTTSRMGIWSYLIQIGRGCQDGWIGLLFIAIGGFERNGIVDGHFVAGFGEIETRKLVVWI